MSQKLGMAEKADAEQSPSSVINVHHNGTLLNRKVRGLDHKSVCDTPIRH